MDGGGVACILIIMVIVVSIAGCIQWIANRQTRRQRSAKIQPSSTGERGRRQGQLPSSDGEAAVPTAPPSLAVGGVPHMLTAADGTGDSDAAAGTGAADVADAVTASATAVAGATATAAAPSVGGIPAAAAATGVAGAPASAGAAALGGTPGTAAACQSSATPGADAATAATAVEMEAAAVATAADSLQGMGMHPSTSNSEESTAASRDWVHHPDLLKAIAKQYHALQDPATIARLRLKGVVVDAPLLVALQGLPSLTHLDLYRVNVAPNIKGHCFPPQLTTLTITTPNSLDGSMASAFGRLLSGLPWDTISNIRVTTPYDSPNLNLHHNLLLHDGLRQQRLGFRSHALRRLSMPCVRLNDRLVGDLRGGAPLLEDLEVYSTAMHQRNDDEGEPLAVTWRTLRVTNLHLDGCGGLPLGGAGDALEIHVKGALRAEDDALATSFVFRARSSDTAGRGVRLVGSGRDNGTFVWNRGSSITGQTLGMDWVLLLLTSCSKDPVTRLDLFNFAELRPYELFSALITHGSVVELKIHMRDWASVHANMLARLLVVVRVCLVGDTSDACLRAFKSLLVEVGRVSDRVARPLRVCILIRPEGGEVATPLRSGSELWESVAGVRGW